MKGRGKEPWVLVAGGFHCRGGMDKANLALAEHLIAEGNVVHLITHAADPRIERHPLATVYRVPRPAGSYFLGEWWLDRVGRRVARQVLAERPSARVLVNGGNCLWPADLNWVHYVHDAWRPESQAGPVWFQAKSEMSNRVARSRELKALRRASVLIANSNVTRRHIVERFGVSAGQVHTVYLGAEPDWGPVTPEQRRATRTALGLDESRPVAVFVGALGHDHRKGFDVLFEAWRRLCRPSATWDADLLVAGAGNALEMWRSKARQFSLAERIRFLGFSEEIKDVLAAADVLVSPVRYESYGLNVQEAVCRGVPALVSASAGIADRYPTELTPMLLADPEDPADLMATLRLWRSQMARWRACFERFGEQLRSYSWRDMARQIVALTEEGSRVNGYKRYSL